MERTGIVVNNMPELPEVETVKNVLNKIVPNKKIIKIDVLRKSTIIGDPYDFCHSLLGKTFKEVTRIGKFLVFHLTDDVVLISHLRMEGKYFELKEEERNTYFSRVVFHLDNGTKLCYDDSRCFGIMISSTEKDYLSTSEISKLGKEPFDIDNVQYLLDKTKKLKGPIKTTITDQTVIAGIGNIYADEILFACKIHPLTPTNLLTVEDWENIRIESSKILKEAIKQGGSTVRSYHPGKDLDGKFQNNLKAYGREGQKCTKCGHKMKFIKINGRGTTFCPICQKRLGGPLKLGIYGKIASGKSHALKIIQDMGYPTISADDVVSNLYKKIEIQDQILKMFNVKNESFSKELIRSLILNPSNRRKLDSYIHPLVKNEILAWSKKQNATLLAVEVPLLYESGMDEMFDYVLAIDVDVDSQQDRLLKRSPKIILDMLKINQTSKFDKNKEKADFVIHNNLALNSFDKSVNEIINKLLQNQN